MIKESHVEYEKLHIENCQESSKIKCPKSYLVSLKKGKPKCETARNWGQRGSTERGKETPLVLTIKLQWSLGPISSTAQPTKHKSVISKRTRRREGKTLERDKEQIEIDFFEKRKQSKPLKQERRNDDTLVVAHWRIGEKRNI